MCISTRFQLHKIAMIRLLTLSPVFVATLCGAADSQQAVTALARLGLCKIAPLKPDFSGFVGPGINIGPSNRKMGHEGCVIRKIEDKYVLFGTAWSTDKMRHGTYNLYYCTADNVTGPYGPRKFAGRFLGHGTPFQDKQGRWWCTAFYNANVPPLSREEAKTKDLSDNAYTINKQGLTLVPLDVRVEDNDVQIRAKEANYATLGPEEAQNF